MAKLVRMFTNIIVVRIKAIRSASTSLAPVFSPKALAHSLHITDKEFRLFPLLV